MPTFDMAAFWCALGAGGASAREAPSFGLPGIFVYAAFTVGIFYLTGRLTTIAARTRLRAVLWAAVSLWSLSIMQGATWGMGFVNLVRVGSIIPPEMVILPIWAKGAMGYLTALSLWAWVVFAKFTFRPTNSRYWGVVVLSGALMSVGTGLMLSVDKPNIVLPFFAGGAARLTFVLGGIIGLGWLSWEAWRHWRMFSRELDDDDTLDPLVVNRFLLWGLASVAMCVLFAVSLFLTPNLPSRHQPMAVNFMLMGAILTAAALAFLGLAPPPWYRRRFARPDAPQSD